jgi:hypothetical protein
MKKRLLKKRDKTRQDKIRQDKIRQDKIKRLSVEEKKRGAASPGECGARNFDLICDYNYVCPFYFMLYPNVC